jgi:hypothetical protein
MLPRNNCRRKAKMLYGKAKSQNAEYRKKEVRNEGADSTYKFTLSTGINY